ncbi:unnamed protein product, partial [Prorocentrum cordatum]
QEPTLASSRRPPAARASASRSPLAQAASSLPAARALRSIFCWLEAPPPRAGRARRTVPQCGDSGAPCSPSAAPPPSRAARSSTRSPAPRPCGRWGTTSPLTPGGPTLLAHGPRVGKADRDNNVDRTPTWARDQVGFGSLSLPMVTKRTGYKRGRPPRPSSEEGMAEEGEEEGGRRRGRH